MKRLFMLAQLVVLGIIQNTLTAQCPSLINQRNNGNSAGCEFTIVFSGGCDISDNLATLGLMSLTDYSNGITYNSFSTVSIVCKSGNLEVCAAPDVAGDNNLGVGNLKLEFSNGLVCNYASSNALPLSFASFETLPNINGTTQLIWHTEDEQNIAFYEVQCSKDEFNFQPVLSIFQDAKKGGVYEAMHTPKLNSRFGKVYYRIIGVDNNGNRVYSTVNDVAFRIAETPITISPNPVVKGNLYTLNNIFIDDLKSGNERLVVTNVFGQIIQSVPLQQYVEEVVLDTQNLSAGLYSIRVIRNAEVLQQATCLVID
ncbi:MAG: hypothetical protein KA103_03675 [Saprospiraceae bacterium]|nr:hypothetical protein [Saprospiraceae bacterium]